MKRSDLRDSTTIWLMPMVVLLVVGMRVDLFVWGDTWYNLTLGREIAQNGIMRTDALSAVWLGLPVADAQWLAHLIFYGVARGLGVAAVPMLGLLLVATTLLSVALAHVVRRDASGARATRPGLVLITLALVLMGMGAQIVLRAQTLVYPVVCCMLWVMQRRLAWSDTDTSTGSRPHAPWVLLPLIVLWANLHGSVLLAPLFGGAACAAILVEGLSGLRSTWRRDFLEYIAFTMLAAVCVLCTPYGLELVAYYRDTAGSARFRDMITEWFPVWAAPAVSIVVLVSVVATVVLRASGQWFARFVLAGLAFMTVMSVRHATPLALATLVLLPPLLEQQLPARWTFSFDELPSHPVRAVCALAGLWLVVGVPWRLQPALSLSAISASVGAVQRAAAQRPNACLFIDEQQTERFLWFAPELRGRVAHGVRVETMPSSYLLQVARMYREPGNPTSHRYLARFDVIVLDSRLHEQVVASLAADSAFVQLVAQHPMYVFQARDRERATADEPTPCAEAREDAAREVQQRSRPVVNP